MLVSLLAVAPARADDMDLSLSRLRISAGNTGCTNVRSAAQFCPDNGLFERLVSELAVAMAPAPVRPAHTGGHRGLRLAVSGNVTGIDAGATHWALGSEGSGGRESNAAAATPGDGIGQNDAPSRVLVWNRVEVEKGLPFGLSAGGFVGHGMQTSLWMLGGRLQWALFEGFYSELGRLPDVAVAASYGLSAGSDQARFAIGSAELLLSKPYVVDAGFELLPMLGLQLLFTDVESGVVDLTPVVDAVAACAPQPGTLPAAGPPAAVTCADDGDGSDLDNDVRFDDVEHMRLRTALGGRLRWDHFTVSLSLAYDLLLPELEHELPRGSASGDLRRQLSMRVALGAEL
ncbi:MAG: hypothetical protein OEZ06_18925 [Myxococcales bacterium]|nr:hypothetical protein [Myxococcales bacterium]